MRHRVHVPLASDPASVQETEAIPAGDGCFRLVGTSSAQLRFKRGEIVECTILALPDGSKGLVATRSLSADPEFQKRRATFALCGAIVGGAFGAALGLWFEFTLHAAAVGGIVGAIAFAIASVRWGDNAWDALSRVTRWF